MNRRTPVDGSGMNCLDDPMQQFNLDRLAMLDARLHRGHRERYSVIVRSDCDVRIVIEFVLMGVR